MSGREQISPSGLAFLMFGFLMGSTLLLPMGAPAKQAAWLATALGGLSGVVVAWVYTRLAVQFPGECLVGYSRVILGRWGGSLVSLLYLWYGFHLGALVLRNFGEFLLTALLPTTPISVIILTLMALCAFAVRTGLEPLARASQVLVLVVVALVVITMVLLAKEAEPRNLQPWFSDQPASILRAALTILTFPFGETIIFAMVIPQVRPAGSVPRTVMRTILAATFVLTATAALSTAVLGSHIRGTSRFSTLALIRHIVIADFITNLDALVVGAWVFNGFLKASACLYFCATGLAEWLGLREYRSLVPPIAILMVGMSILVYQDVSEMTTFLNIWAVYSLPFQVLMPLVLLLVAQVRGLGQQEGSSISGG